MQPLPIDPFLDTIIAAVRASRAAVVTAAPGAGKTTRVPPALLDDGPVILLQPRRAAARALAARIAAERGWAIGADVGWQIRGERRVSAATRLLVATEGVLTARLQRDPLLSDFRTIVIDEFHERSVHADLALALARQAWRARDDLRIVVMSATIESAAAASFLEGCPIVDVPGRTFPIDVAYTPGQSIAGAVGDLIEATDGGILCFLPGAAEIRRAMQDIHSRLRGGNVDVVPLYGALSARDQDAVLRRAARRRIIVATNIAETSVTVPDVTAVVDAGLQKVARYDAARGVDSLDIERITQDAADQRAGRAGRVAPGVVRRLWEARDRLRPHREAEIHRVDLCGALLDVIAWGGDPRRFEWFDPPREDALDSAMRLLERLGLVANGVLTAIGGQAVRLPLHPRLARMLIAAGGAREMARVCALIGERHYLAPRTEASASDLLSALDAWSTAPDHVQRAAREIEGAGGALGPQPSELSDAAFRRAILAGYPDRVAHRREAGSPRVRLSSGAGAVIAPESGVIDGEFLVAVDVQAPRERGTAGAEVRRVRTRAQPAALETPNDARVRVASLVDRAWLTPTETVVEHWFDPVANNVRAAQIDRYDELVLAERNVPVDPDTAAALLAEAWLARGPREEDRAWLARLRFAGGEVDVSDVVRRASAGARTLDDVHLPDALPPAVQRTIDRDAPLTITVPSGRAVPLKYGEDGSVSAAVKLQELFGLAETPRIGPRREPVLLALLAPNGRPVQMTRDLRSFWERTYPEVRKELRGRYPKHPWPEDPWSAPPTARAKPRG